MRCDSVLRRALRRYGTDVKIRQNGRTEAAKAFVQPLRRGQSLYLGDKEIPAGHYDETYRLYIGDRRIPLSYDGRTLVECKGKTYTVIAEDEYILGNETLYIRAILREKNPLKEDDYDELDR
jgi:hypothetical protein